MTSPHVTGRGPARRIEAALRAVLPRSASVRLGRGESAADAYVDGVPLHLTWVGEGGLRQVRQVLARSRPLPDIVVARRVSPGAREALSDAGVGWVDETGAAEIAIGSILVSRSGRPDSRPTKRPRWTPSVLAIAEALLCGTAATVAATSEVTRLSVGACTKALRVLTEFRLLTSSAQRGRDSGRTLADVDTLLDAYATATAAQPRAVSVQVGVTWRDLVSGLTVVGRRWKKDGVEWAATGALAASVIAPHLTTVTTGEVYVDGETVAAIESIAERADMRPIEGGRIRLLPFPTMTTRLLAEGRHGLRVAPWPRVYADLRVAGVRGEEAAEHLREVLRGR